MTKNTIDDRINTFLMSITTKEPDVVGKLGQALYQDLMALVGEDEPFKNLYQWQQAEPINLEKQRIRQNINQYFKRGDGDG